MHARVSAFILQFYDSRLIFSYFFNFYSAHCALHIFISQFTRDVFLSQIHIEMGTALNEATRKLDMWKSVNPTDSLQHLKATRPLLQVDSANTFF